APVTVLAPVILIIALLLVKSDTARLGVTSIESTRPPPSNLPTQETCVVSILVISILHNQSVLLVAAAPESAITVPPNQNFTLLRFALVARCPVAILRKDLPLLDKLFKANVYVNKVSSVVSAAFT